MHKAAAGGQLEVIKFLSQKCATRIHETDNNGYSMLHWATLSGHSEVARYLIQELKMDLQDIDKVSYVGWNRRTCVQGIYRLCCVNCNIYTYWCPAYASIMVKGV